MLFAGGTGITAFTAFLEGLTPAYPHQVTLFYGARRAALFLYWEMIAAQATSLPQLAVHYFVEQDALGEQFRLGRLSAEVALHLIEAPSAVASYYLSGPPVMLQALRDQLHQQGATLDVIFVDAWE